MRRLWIVFVIAGLIALGWGLHQGQASTVRRWASTLCTSCIGLSGEESGH